MHQSLTLFTKPLAFILCLMALLMSTHTLAANKVPESAWQQLSAELQLQPGDLVYLDFWASWCGPCRKSFPWMNQMQAKYKLQGLKVLAVNLDTEKDLATHFLAQTPSNFNIYYDPKGEFAQLLQLQGMPSSFIIDAQGQILAAHKGFFEHKTQAYEQELQQLLRQTNQGTQDEKNHL